jgi:dienelactone hydrolase
MTSQQTDVRELDFEPVVDGEPVPGVLWTPADADKPLPTVLIGHGRTIDKRHPYLVEFALSFVRRGLAAVAIDAPGHGDRRADTDADWPRPDAAQAAREWRACVDMLVEAGHVDGTTLGYWGVSMGTSLGITFLAEHPAVRAAVLGLMHPNWPTPPGERIRADARRLACPILFQVNWDDQLVPVAQACELFDLIGSKDKRLHAYPGGHGELPQEAIAASQDFLLSRLTTTD